MWPTVCQFVLLKSWRHSASTYDLEAKANYKAKSQQPKAESKMQECWRHSGSAYVLSEL